MGSCTSKKNPHYEHDNLDDTYYKANQDDRTNDEMSYQEALDRETRQMIASMNKKGNNW
mgnify:FL=1|tara:strand:- start:797 stop:973 length:177 start_codon:yes stop_codon:yes gene_type:complete